MNPTNAIRDDSWPAIDECFDTEVTELVAARGHKHHVTSWLRLTQDPHQLEPARKASPSLASTPIPATPRRHDYKRRQSRISACHLCRDVEGLNGCPADVREHLHVNAS